jgi:hypothetical protein
MSIAVPAVAAAAWIRKIARRRAKKSLEDLMAPPLVNDCIPTALGAPLRRVVVFVTEREVCQLFSEA